MSALARAGDQLGKLELLAGQVAEVEAGWKRFSAHARSCGKGCTLVALVCRRPGVQSEQIDPKWDSCCEVGKPLFSEWRLAVRILRDTEDRKRRP